MSQAIITIAAARARANERCDGMVERIYETDDVLGLKRVRINEPGLKLAARIKRAPAHLVPALRPGRPMNAARQCTLHVKFDEKTDKPAAEHDRYMTHSRDAGAKMREPVVGDVAAATDAAIGAAEFDRYSVESRIVADADRPAEQIFTNMPGTSVERQATWSAIEANERSLHTQGIDRVNIRFERDPAFFLEIAGDPDCPPRLKDLIHREEGRVATGEKLPKHASAHGVGYIAEDARRTDGWLKSKYHQAERGAARSAPFKFSTSRRVQTHRRGDGELPKELDELARQRVCAGVLAYVCSKASPEDRRVVLRDGRVVEGALPIIVVLHPPEAVNHADNWHYHFMFSDRAIAHESDGTVAFAETKCELTKLGMHDGFRDECARLINIELEAASAGFSVSGRSFKDLDIPATPQQHLGAKGLELEARGILTDTNIGNRIESWRRHRREIAQRHRAAAASLEAEDTALQRQLDATTGSDAGREACRHLYSAIRMNSTAIAQAAADADDFRLLIEMQRSGPVAALAKNRRLAAGARGSAPHLLSKIAAMELDLAALDEELRPEHEALAACDARHAELAQTRQGLVSQLARDLDRTAGPSAVRDDGHTAPDLAAATRRSPPEVHRIVDALKDLPIRLVEVHGLLRVRSDDDRQGIARDQDLSGADIQTRLRAIHITQLSELKICADIIVNGHRSFRDCGRLNFPRVAVG